MSSPERPFAVTVRFLASYQEELGVTELSVKAEPGLTVEGLLRRLRERFPGWASAASKPLVARNLEYARGEEVLQEGDEVAIFPPVSGG